MFNKKRALAAIALATGTALTFAGCAGGAAPEDAAPTFDPNEKVTLSLAFWGNDVRADLYNRAIDAFNEEYPNITVNSTFLAYSEFWEKRQTEAAGRNLPDVMQFDYEYLRQYSENGLLLDLDPYVGGIIESEPLGESILSIGVVNDTTYAIPTSTNALGLFTNLDLLESVGMEDFAGGTWDDYAAWMAEVTEASGGDVYGGVADPTFASFELQLRAEGLNLFTEDGGPGFDEERLAQFWESRLAAHDGVIVPQQRVEELQPLSGFDAGQAASELTWDNFGAGFLGNLGIDASKLSLLAPPVTVDGAKDLYLKPAMLHAIAANTKHPEAAATLVNFLINSPQSGQVFGANRGLPASATALAAADLDPLSQQVKAYEEAIADRIGDTPPVPPVGAGTLGAKFRQLSGELNFGTVTVDEAVSQFFAEMDVVLAG